MICVGRGLFNGLVEWGEDGKPNPELAESWEPSHGAADWVFNLRKGVKFSNGKEFDADDAIYSLNLHRGDTKSGAAGPLKAVTDVKKLDKHQIQITLAAGDADLPYMLTDYHVLMVPDGFTDWANPVGTGAFRSSSSIRACASRSRRNPNYWKPGRGHLDAVEITVINDCTARLNALISGQVDAINRVDPKAVALVEERPKLKSCGRRAAGSPIMAMMVDQRPLRQSRPPAGAETRASTASSAEDACSAATARSATTTRSRRPTRSSTSELPQTQVRSGQGQVLLQEGRGLPTRRSSCRRRDAAFDGAVDMARCFRPTPRRRASRST